MKDLANIRVSVDWDGCVKVEIDYEPDFPLGMLFSMAHRALAVFEREVRHEGLGVFEDDF